MHLVPEFVELHQHLKTAGLNHTLHFVVPFTLQIEAQDAKVALDGLFEKITVHVLEWEPYGGWPYAPNMHFYACANAMLNDNKALPWQLVELDCRPIRANAYDVIAAKYASCGAPFFGYVGKTPWRTDNGRITKSMHGDGDVMMSGCAVYPGNLLERPNMSGLMADFMKGESSIGDAWDIHLRFAMQTDGMAHTELIGNYWNTDNFRVENGRLRCDSRKTHEIFDQHPDWERRECGGPVHPDAVMIHGCKDESLFKLVLAGGIPDSYTLPTLVQAMPKAEESKFMPEPSTPADARIDKVEAMLAQMMQMMMAKNTPSEPPPPQPPSPECEPVIAKLLQVLPEVGSKERLGKLCAALSTKKELVKTALESCGKFSIKGPAEWVERIAA
jgi:hypothetical protein